MVDICVRNRYRPFERPHDCCLNRFGNLTAHAVN
jgi:hypothetical protein